MKIEVLILGTKKTGKTGRLLAASVNGTYVNYAIPNWDDFNVIWRWGNFYTELPNNFQGNVINRASACFRNKAESRDRLLRSGISCPKMFNSNTISQAKFPVLARPVFHMQGKDFNIVQTEAEAREFLQRGYYVQAIVETMYEYRLFIFDNRVLECNVKELIRVPVKPLHPLIKNWRNGYIFRHQKMSSMNNDLLLQARQAQILSGLNFCAVDCAITADGMPYVFETNAAPGLIERKAKKFSKRILEIMGFPKVDVNETFGITAEEACEAENVREGP